VIRSRVLACTPGSRPKQLQATDGWDAFERREGEEHGPIITSKGHTLVLEDLE